MKFLVLVVTLTTSLCANAYNCKGVDASGNAIRVDAQLGSKIVYLSLGTEIFKETVKLKSFQGSSMGHSRCPGTWSGVTFQGQNSTSKFKSLSIVTEESFFDCGRGPSDSLVLNTKIGSEIIHLACKE